MTASYLSLEVAWKLTPPCLARRVPCQSRSWGVVRWYRGARWVPRRLEVQGCLAQYQLAIPVGWGLQKSRCWQTKPWRSSLQKLKHLPLAALCWLLSRDYRPRLSTGRMEPLARALQRAAQRLGKTSVRLPFRLNPPLLWSCLPALWWRQEFVAEEKAKRVAASWNSCYRALSGCDSKPLGSEIARNGTSGSSVISQSAEQQPLTSLETHGVSIYLH